MHGVRKQLEEIVDSCIDIQRRANSVIKSLDALVQEANQLELPFDPFSSIIKIDEKGKKTFI